MHHQNSQTRLKIVRRFCNNFFLDFTSMLSPYFHCVNSCNNA
uniref:Uncharacterized protein n=1 Tax=Anguilla anguilla TaxID=7936 RepID=A0A0E9W214_ANGAN